MENVITYLSIFSSRRIPIKPRNLIYFLLYLTLCYLINLLLYYISVQFIKLNISGITFLNERENSNLVSIKILIITVFLVPTTEEILFRLGIIFSPVKPSLLIIGIYTSIPYLLIRSSTKSDTLFHTITLSIIPILFILSYCYFKKEERVKINWNKKFT